jgi:hypothetical protein
VAEAAREAYLRRQAEERALSKGGGVSSLVDDGYDIQSYPDYKTQGWKEKRYRSGPADLDNQERGYSSAEDRRRVKRTKHVLEAAGKY